MNWIDYRKALGLCFEDKEKEQAFCNKLFVLLDILNDKSLYFEDAACKCYFMTVCEKPPVYYRWHEIKDSFQNSKGFYDLLSKSVALLNCLHQYDTNANSREDDYDYTNNDYSDYYEKDIWHDTCGSCVESYLLTALDDLRIPFEIKKDENNVFIFPKGAKELDDNNVSIPFQWLSTYPEARKAMADALRAYSNSENYSNTADLYRKALERFLQLFFNSEKSLENLKAEYGQFMKNKGVPKELSGNFETLLQMYTNYMNNYAKHQDKTKKEFLEFIMYQTGNIIRFIISLSDS